MKKKSVRRENTLNRISTPRYNLNSFINESTKYLFQQRLDQKLLDIQSYTYTEVYDNILTSLHETAQEALGTQKNMANKKIWWNQEIENAVKQKKESYLKWLNTKEEEDRQKYHQCKRQARQLVTMEKNKIWDNKCQEIDTYIGGRKNTEVWNFIRSLKNTGKNNAYIQTIQPEEWREHYKNLLQETRQEYLLNSTRRDIYIEGEEVQVSIDTVKNAVGSLKNGKACGPEGIYAEMLKNGTPKLLENLTYVINECLNGNPVPDQWKVAYISSIHKKGNKRDCNNYRGISVTSTMSRLYGRILRDLIEDDFKDHEEEEQSGFRAGRSCNDNVFCLKQIIEKRAARNMETHLAFVDLHKAYDTVPISELWRVLEQSNISVTYIRALKELYKDSRSRIKIGDSLTDEFLVTKGLRQGCCISPTLFKIYIATALKKWKRKTNGMGIELVNKCMYTLQFADDQVVIANDKEDLEYMMRKLIEEYNHWGLSVNIDKTKYLCIGNEASNLDLENGQNISHCQSYVYLGVTFNEAGTDSQDIDKRIVQAKKIIGCLNGILWSNNISKKRKFNIYETMVKSTLLHGAETWRITERYKRKIEAVEMDAMRRSLRISRRDHIRNDSIKQQMGIEGSIVTDVEAKQLTWYGHVQRMPATRLPKQVMEWQPTQRRKRGRPRIEWQQTVKKSMSERNLRTEECDDRKGWKLGVGQRRKTF